MRGGGRNDDNDDKMHFHGAITASLLFFLTIIPAVLAQSPSLMDLAAQMPPCIIQCFVNEFLGPDPICNATDVTCLCTSKPLAAKLAVCTTANCTLADTLMAANVSAETCNSPSQNKQAMTEITFTTLMALSFVFVMVRIYVRMYIQTDSHLGIDDYITAFNLLAWSAYSLSVLLSAIPEGLGKDDWDLTTHNVSMLSMHSFIGQIVYSFVNASVKLALLFFYLRIFPETHTRRVILATIAFIMCYALAFAIVGVFLCEPVDYFWRQWVEDSYQGQCVNYLMPSYIYAAFGIALDVFIMAIPLSQLRKLNMGWKKKLSVGMMFSVGILIVAVSVARFVTILNFSFTSGFSSSWTLAQLYTTVEVNVGIICTCFPSCRLLLVHYFPKLRGSTIRPSGALYEDGNEYFPGGSRNMSKLRTGTHTAVVSTAFAGSPVSVETTTTTTTTTDKPYPVEHTDMIYTGPPYPVQHTDRMIYTGVGDEVELTKLSTSTYQTRRHGVLENMAFQPPALSGPAEGPGGGRWVSYDIERRPVSKEGFI